MLDKLRQRLADCLSEIEADGARLPRDSAKVMLVGGGWFSMVSTEFPARDRPGCVPSRYGLLEMIDGNDEVALTQLPAAGEIHAARSKANCRSLPRSLAWIGS